MGFLTKEEKKYILGAGEKWDGKTIHDKSKDITRKCQSAFDDIIWLLENMPGGPVFAKPPRKIPEAQILSRTEAPRGELIHYLWSNNTNKPYRLKITTPTLANILSVSEMLKGDYIADSTISLASIDPCFSCEDRMITVVNKDRRKSKVWTWNFDQLRKYSLEWNAKNKRWKK